MRVRVRACVRAVVVVVVVIVVVVVVVVVVFFIDAAFDFEIISIDVVFGCANEGEALEVS